MSNDYPLTLEHVKQFLATKQDGDELGICYDAMYCVLSETLNWLYPRLAPWRVDISSYTTCGCPSHTLDEPLDFLRRAFDSTRWVAPRHKRTVTKAELRSYLEWMPEEFAGKEIPFSVRDLFAEKAREEAR